MSLRKGGCSVLADAYLVAGNLSLAEAEFFFGYGVALQLLDDLQDASADRRAGHLTLFSHAAESRPLDALTSRLGGLVARILELGEDRFPQPENRALWTAIRRNCTQLLLGAVAQQPALFTRAYLRRLERRSRLSFAAMRWLRRRAQRRHEAVAKDWHRRGLHLSALETL